MILVVCVGVMFGCTKKKKMQNGWIFNFSELEVPAKIKVCSAYGGTAKVSS